MTGADVRDIPALREWVAALQVFAHDAGDALSSTRTEIRRAEEWVSRQLELWQRAVRVSEEMVVQARAELAARKFPGFDGKMPDTTVQERNLRRAVARLEHCEARVVKCRKLMVQLPKLVDEIFTAAGHRLGAFLEVEVPTATAQMQRRIESLERYAESRADYSAASLPTAPAAAPPEQPK